MQFSESDDASSPEAAGPLSAALGGMSPTADGAGKAGKPAPLPAMVHVFTDCGAAADAATAAGAAAAVGTPLGNGYGWDAPPALPAAAVPAAGAVYTDPEEAILAALANELRLQEELLQQELALFEEQRWGQLDQGQAQGQAQVEWQQQLQLSAALAPAQQQQQQQHPQPQLGGVDAAVSVLSSPAQSHYGTPRSSDLSGGYAGGRLSPFSARPASAAARAALPWQEQRRRVQLRCPGRRRQQPISGVSSSSSSSSSPGSPRSRRCGCTIHWLGPHPPHHQSQSDPAAGRAPVFSSCASDASLYPYRYYLIVVLSVSELR
jgi:hypothetical protein